MPYQSYPRPSPLEARENCINCKIQFKRRYGALFNSQKFVVEVKLNGRAHALHDWIWFLKTKCKIQEFQDIKTSRRKKKKKETRQIVYTGTWEHPDCSPKAIVWFLHSRRKQSNKRWVYWVRENICKFDRTLITKVSRCSGEIFGSVLYS